MHDGRHFARVIVRHHVRQPYHFLFHLIHGRSHRDYIARAQLAFVFDALLNTCNPAFFLLHPRTGQPHRRKELPARLVKFPHVPHHVHMSHMIAMLGLHHSAIRDRTLTLGHASPRSKRIRRQTESVIASQGWKMRTHEVFRIRRLPSSRHPEPQTSPTTLTSPPCMRLTAYFEAGTNGPGLE